MIPHLRKATLRTCAGVSWPPWFPEDSFQETCVAPPPPPHQTQHNTVTMICSKCSSRSGGKYMRWGLVCRIDSNNLIRMCGVNQMMDFRVMFSIVPERGCPIWHTRLTVARWPYIHFLPTRCRACVPNRVIWVRHILPQQHLEHQIYSTCCIYIGYFWCSNYLKLGTHVIVGGGLTKGPGQLWSENKRKTWKRAGS